MTNLEGIITETISDTIAPGLTVYDLEGKKVGAVDSVDRDTGWFTVSTSDFSNKSLYLPFSLITNIDPRDLFVSRTKSELHATYSDPPARSTLVTDVEGTEMATTSEPSGYDGAPIVVEIARIDELKEHITNGSHVYTSDMADLGTIKEYDRVTGLMRVERGIMAKHDLLVPVTLVDSVDEDTHEVYLAYSQADLRRMQHLEPVDVVMVATQIRETD